MLLATIDLYAIDDFRPSRHVLHRSSGVLDDRVAPITDIAWRHVGTATSSALAEKSTFFAINLQARLSRYLGNMLDRLPSEILHLVLQNLATSPDLVHKKKTPHGTYSYHRSNWATLAQLCKVSRSMKYVAEPLLYRNYAKPDSTLDPNKHHAFRQFLVTVLGRPELLQHVRFLYIGAWRYQPGPIEYRQFAASGARNSDTKCPDELPSLCNKYAGTSVLGVAWREALEAGEEAAEIALLMSLTPNLEHIEFCMPDFILGGCYAPQYFWPSLLVASDEWDPACHFHRLESVMIHRRDLEAWRHWRQSGRAQYGFEVTPFWPFIELPSLRVFWVENDAIGHYKNRTEEYPLILKDEELQLTELTLGKSYMDPVKMIQLLKRCTKLEAFGRELEQPNDWLIPRFSWKPFKEALANSRGTLEELTFNAEGARELLDGHGSLGSYLSIGPLTDFTSLRSLNVLQPVLLGVEFFEGYSTLGPAPPFEELLPSSLESLTIDECSPNIIPYLEDMLTKLVYKFPHLREIISLTWIWTGISWTKGTRL
jgi:hypothetical protein